PRTLRATFDRRTGRAPCCPPPTASHILPHSLVVALLPRGRLPAHQTSPPWLAPQRALREAEPRRTGPNRVAPLPADWDPQRHDRLNLTPAGGCRVRRAAAPARSR